MKRFQSDNPPFLGPIITSLISGLIFDFVFTSKYSLKSIWVHRLVYNFLLFQFYRSWQRILNWNIFILFSFSCSSFPWMPFLYLFFNILFPWPELYLYVDWLSVLGDLVCFKRFENILFWWYNRYVLLINVVILGKVGRWVLFLFLLIFWLMK